MNAQKEYFIYLLSRFLNSEEAQGRDCDFAELYRLSDIHDVSAIVANVLKNSDIEITSVKYKSYFTQRLGFSVQEYELKTKAKTYINDFLNSIEAKHIFVKGILLREIYPVKELRSSGDIDVIVEEDDFERVHSEVKKQGITIVSYVSDTLILKVFDTEIEIHKNSDVKNIYFDKIFTLDLIKTSDFEYQLNDYDHLLYVICHLKKHITYRGAGIRMLMDIDVLVRNIPNFECNSFLEKCKDAKIEQTAKMLFSLCNYWFDTPVNAYINYDEDTDLLSMLETVLIDGGSFGYEMSSIPASYYENGNSNLKVFFKLAFPGREHLKKAYPYYNKNKVLLPIARLNRLIDGVFKKRKTAKNAIDELSANNKNNYQIELIKELSKDEEE